MQRPVKAVFRRLVVAVVVLTGVAYAPVAMTELWPYAHPGAPAYGEWVLSHTVSPRYVADAVATRVGPYERSLIAMIVHSVLGGALMLIGPLQLLSALRRRRRLHRAAGVVFAVSVYVSMVGAAVYLVRTEPDDAFSGPAFWIVLATILVGTVMSVTLGIVAAVQRFPDVHQRWMLLCYGFLMTAPLLRLEWGALPMILPGLSLEQINQVAIMHMGSVVVFGALVGSRALDRRKEVAGVNGTWMPAPLLVALHVAGALALAWIVRAFAQWDAGHRLMAAYLLPYAAVYAVLAVCQWRAGRGGRHWAREEWRLHLAAHCLAPVFSAVAAVLLEWYPGLGPRTALISGVSVGCGMLASMATSAVGLRVLHGRTVTRRRQDAARPPERTTASAAG